MARNTITIMTKPSVLMFNRVYPPVSGASGRVLRDLARGFVADGWHVTIITTGPQDTQDNDGPIRIVRIKAPARPPHIFSYIRIWLRMMTAGLRLKRRDLVVTLTDPPLLAVAGAFIARRKRSRHMHWCHDLYPDLLPALGMNLLDFMMRFLQKRSLAALQRCDRIVVIGRCMARRLIRQGIAPKRISMIPNWPDPELVAPARRPRRAASGAAVVQNDLFADSEPKFRVLYAGTMGRAHPMETIIEAAATLGQTHPEIEFVFVGAGQGFERLAKERAKRNLQNIRLMPWQPVSRLRALMESGDLHLISMSHDAAGMLVPCKFYSAMAAARPCVFVGPYDSEIARTIRDYKAGIALPQGDSAPLVAAIKRYRDDPEQWFAAHEGAAAAGKVFLPQYAIAAWIGRARGVLRLPRAKGAGAARDAFASHGADQKKRDVA